MNKFKNAISNIAALGSTLSLGVLSFSGMLLITPSLPIAGLTFFLAVAIEGAVYRQNIFAAMQRLGNQKLLIERAIAQRELKKIKKTKEYEHNDFLCDYFNQKNYLHDLEENLASYSDEDEATANQEIFNVKERLAEMEDLFIHSIRNPLHNSSIRQLFRSRQIISVEKLDQEVNSKKRLMNFTLIAAFAASVCAGLVTLSSMQSCLLVAGIGLSTATIIAAPFVVFAACGYMLMMYRTVTDMIQNDTVQKWGNEFRKFWNTPRAERKASHYLKALGVVALAALAVTATIATAGTWWYLAKAGAETIKFLPSLGAKIISAASWGLTLFPNFFFNVVNAIKSINKIPGIVKKAVHNVSHGLKETWHAENVVQFINPFRVIKKLFNAAIFIGHLISMAVTSDQTPGVNPIASTSANLMMEGLTDLHYVVDDKHSHSHSEGHSIQQPLIHKKHKHHHDDDDHHHHGDFLLTKIDSFFNYLSAGWDCVFSGNAWQVSKNKFMPAKVLPQAKQLSSEWVTFEVNSKLEKKAEEYKQKGLTTKAAAFQQLKIKIQPENELKQVTADMIHKQIKVATSENQPLTLHRHSCRFFSKKPPRSTQFIDDMLRDKSLGLVRSL